MAGLPERFESKVDRSGDHHVWLGSRLADGSGQIRVNGRLTTARRVAWELEHGALPPAARVKACPDEPACVRVTHLTVTEANGRSGRRAPRGSGSKLQVRPGVWKLTVAAGRYADGSIRREHRTVRADTTAEASELQAGFVTEVRIGPVLKAKIDRDITMDDGIERFLTEYLAEEKGRATGTIVEYRTAHNKWFSPEIGRRRVRDIDEAAIDHIFGKMRKAGLSGSRMNGAKNLYAPFFRWAKRRGIIRRSPMAEFEMPTSLYVERPHVPPEVDQLSRYLRTAVEVAPDVAPLLTLGAVTGMRRGELVSLRRSRLLPRLGQLRIDAASDGKRVKTTKTRKERDVAVDPATMAMLQRHCELMDERAALLGVPIVPDAFVFSREVDCSKPVSPGYFTRRVAVLKEHLGISNKRPETSALEDEALRLYERDPEVRPAGKTGPMPAGAISFREIGQRLGRSERWAELAVASAKRRAAATQRGEIDFFDGSILAL
ncbi:MAG TPA: hypothetical protein VGJ86_20155, partial [Acidimicrobiales bacterium]